MKTVWDKVDAINEWLAVRGTAWVGTMWCFYIFIMYGLLPTLFPGATVQLLYWSNVIQMVLLPLILVGQNIGGRSMISQIRETHDAVMEELALVREESGELKQIMTALPGPMGTADRLRGCLTDSDREWLVTQGWIDPAQHTDKDGGGSHAPDH